MPTHFGQCFCPWRRQELRGMLSSQPAARTVAEIPLQKAKPCSPCLRAAAPVLHSPPRVRWAGRHLGNMEEGVLLSLQGEK